MREMSVVEQRYLAVLAVLADGMTVTDAAAKQGVSRQTMHAWVTERIRIQLLGMVPRTPTVDEPGTEEQPAIARMLNSAKSFLTAQHAAHTVSDQADFHVHKASVHPQ
jgi:transposase-like protein